MSFTHFGACKSINLRHELEWLTVMVQTVNKIKCSYELNAGGSELTLRWVDDTSSIYLFFVDKVGASSQTITLG